MAAGCRPERTPGQLVVVTDAPVRSLDPRLAVDSASAKLSRLIFEGLTEVDEQGLPQLVLAESIRAGERFAANGEPLTWIATIRKGVHFHDGALLTGRDVAYTYHSVMDPAFGAIIAGAFRRRFRSVRVSADDPYVVRFELRRPLATFLTDIVLGIAPANLADAPGQHFPGIPIGTGPWQVVKPYALDRVIVSRFMSHRDSSARLPGQPTSLVFRSIVDEGARALSILGGGADVAIGGISPAVLGSAASSGRAHVQSAPGIAWAYMGLNLRHPLLADRRVRMGIARALDRKQLIATLLGGRARIAEGMMAPAHWAHEALPAVAFDRAAADRLLDEVAPKRADGIRFKLQLKVSTNRLRRSVGRAIARDLKRVGIAATVRSFELATFLADVRAGRFEAFLLLLPEPLEPDFLAWMFHTQNAPQKAPAKAPKTRYAALERRALPPGVFSAAITEDPDCGPWSRTAVNASMRSFALAPLGLSETFGSANRTSYHDPLVTCLLELGRSTSNRSERKRLYARAQRRIAADAPVIPLWFEDQTALVRTGVKIPPLTMDGRYHVLARAQLP